MSGRERCDKILALIDEVLAEQPPLSPSRELALKIPQSVRRLEPNAA